MIMMSEKRRLAALAVIPISILIGASNKSQIWLVIMQVFSQLHRFQPLNVTFRPDF